MCPKDVRHYQWEIPQAWAFMMGFSCIRRLTYRFLTISVLLAGKLDPFGFKNMETRVIEQFKDEIWMYLGENKPQIQVSQVQYAKNSCHSSSSSWLYSKRWHDQNEEETWPGSRPWTPELSVRKQMTHYAVRKHFWYLCTLCKCSPNPSSTFCSS